MTQIDKGTSKFLSYVLRHAPDSIGLELDTNGWVAIDTLIKRAGMSGRALTRDKVLTVAADCDKQRFTISEDGTRIRAAQGHSVTVDLALVPVVPPATLFHGTATRFLNDILSEGLKPQSRQQVHLSADIDTARKVGARHGKPVILTIDALGMQADGHRFFQADNGVWLTDAVPPVYIECPA
ncbi:RNA 2'-phosphotransferase [Asticcacaulis sp. BYS171W]|uniref:Probable RNA 2'-phosphotransferase n=1 Tax=Asticcacaulis aquaticus TaxID=2984212 RepID=A0ABT5HZE9_9CAUL|nr:RNA 2'-phosphotransferase [Asticcacaulis aquaticus]MDC7685220.1 RNA 2'-phosphotransferase [Asticcacaulis aquaticus]